LNLCKDFIKKTYSQCFFFVIFSVRTDQSAFTFQLTDLIDLNTLTRLQVQLLFNEIQVKINNGNIFTSIFFRNRLNPMIYFLFFLSNRSLVI